MKLVPTSIETAFEEIARAWVEGDHAKLNEIKQRGEMVKARRKLFRVVRAEDSNSQVQVGRRDASE